MNRVNWKTDNRLPPSTPLIYTYCTFQDLHAEPPCRKDIVFNEVRSRCVEIALLGRDPESLARLRPFWELRNSGHGDGLLGLVGDKPKMLLPAEAKTF